MEAECAMVVARGLGMEETGRDWLSSTNFSYKMNDSEDLMHSLVATADNTLLLFSWNLLRE